MSAAPAAPAATESLGFEAASRVKHLPLVGKAKSTSGQLLQWELPRVGFLRGVIIPIRLTIAGTLSAPNALGQAVIVSEARLTANSGLDLWKVSGVGYHYLCRGFWELNQDIGSYTTGRSAVAAGSAILDMYLPLVPNQRDPLGLLNLQTEQNTYTLSLQFAADSVPATGVTGITGTIEPILEIATVPYSEADYPDDSIVQRVLEDTLAVSSSSVDIQYYPARGDVLLQMVHGYGIGVSGADNWTRHKVTVNQSENLRDLAPSHLDMIRARDGLTTRPLGTIPVDLVGSCGLGNYDRFRDAIDTARLTDIKSVITPSATGTLYTVRRSLTRVG